MNYQLIDTLQKTSFQLIFICLIGFIGSSCSQQNNETASQGSKVDSAAKINPMEYKGVGPVKEIHLEKINSELSDLGRNLFESNCMACHKFESRSLGPALKGVTKRRRPEWIMNMMLNPMEMTKSDPIASQLFQEYQTQMTPTNIIETDSRAILEYFRSVDEK